MEIEMKARCYIPTLGNRAGYISRHIVGGPAGIVREYLRNHQPYERLEIALVDAHRIDEVRGEFRRQSPDSQCAAEMALIYALKR
jgi:hypothetical protein